MIRFERSIKGRDDPSDLKTSSKEWIIPFVILFVALLYRIILTFHFFGWEESDYGNLAMTRGVLDSWFTRYDIGHLAFYYFVSAIFLLATGDTVVSAKGVSVLSGSFSIVVAYYIAKRLGGKWCAILSSLILIFQPEFSLYSSSSLREPLYTLLILLSLHLLIEKRRFILSFILAGFAFLTRFDALWTTFIPIILYLSINRNLRRWAIVSVMIFSVFVAGWSIYCKIYHGTYLFFIPTAVVNIKTGLSGGSPFASDFILNGLKTSVLLLLYIMPIKVGYPLFIFFLFSAGILKREFMRRGWRSLLLLFTLFSLSFWLAIGFYMQHEYGHNLYWKWMYPIVPYVAILGSFGMVRVNGIFAERIEGWKRWHGGVFLTLLLLSNFPFFVRETLFQIDRSVKLYKPQMEIAKWIEREVKGGTTLLLDNIPACYLNRRHHEFNLMTWLDIQITPGSREEFADFLKKEDITYVMWFREEWTKAPIIAPYLGEKKIHRLNGLELVPLFDNDAYGYIFYKVGRKGS